MTVNSSANSVILILFAFSDNLSAEKSKSSADSCNRGNHLFGNMVLSSFDLTFPHPHSGSLPERLWHPSLYLWRERRQFAIWLCFSRMWNVLKRFLVCQRCPPRDKVKYTSDSEAIFYRYWKYDNSSDKCVCRYPGDLLWSSSFYYRTNRPRGKHLFQS